MSVANTSPALEHPVRIVVADANPETRTSYGASLEAQGWDVIEAADGRDALVKALAQPPNLLLTDTQLPFVDGFALCQVLRQDRATRRVPILVVTDQSSDAELQRARESGADAVLTKPVSPDALLQKIRELLAPSMRPASRERLTIASPAPKRPAKRSSLHLREDTTTPPKAPPDLVCPSCDQPLDYRGSHVGGVTKSFAEQWDSYSCPRCGLFEYRHRTRRLRRAV